MSKSVCHGECLFGPCPYPRCLRDSEAKKESVAVPKDTNFSFAPVLSLRPLPILRERGVGLAIDIGSTTLAACTVELETGHRLAAASCLNPQAAFGVDVISRIQYASASPENLKQLQKAVQSGILGLIEEIDAACTAHRIYITGNTLMLSLLVGLSPASMGHAPFTPPSLFGYTCPAEALGLPGLATVHLGRCISSFVGADAVSGLLACGIEGDSSSLLVDIGTNGELLLYTGSTLFAASAAAGPALEGAELSCGMASAAGAISQVELVQGGLSLRVIGGGSPKGLCGSGALDTLALFLELGIVDETGRMNLALAKKAGLATTEEGVFLAPGVVFTAGDVRKIQLAKAAISAGIRTLAASANLPLSQIHRIYLGGGFSTALSLNSAFTVGLLPRQLEGRVISAGNTALLGSVFALLAPKALQRIEEMAEGAQVVDLSAHPAFQSSFIEELLFTETDV